jgi:hypothetical protein
MSEKNKKNVFGTSLILALRLKFQQKQQLAQKQKGKTTLFSVSHFLLLLLLTKDIFYFAVLLLIFTN